MKKIATTLFLCTLLSSCNKESAEGDYITITGFVRDFQDDSPIQGAKIYSKKLTLPGARPGAHRLLLTALCLMRMERRRSGIEKALESTDF